MRRNLSEVFPIMLSSKEAVQALGTSNLQRVAEEFSMKILEKNPTPLEAQAVLVTTWEMILRYGCFSIPHQQTEKGKSQSQT